MFTSQHRVMIKIEFWKSLFEQQLNKSHEQLIYFQSKLSQYWLETLDDSPSVSPALSGYLVLSNTCQLTSDIIKRAKSSEIILIVVQDTKHFDVSYRIYNRESSCGELESLQLNQPAYHQFGDEVHLNLREYLGTSVILEKTSKTNLELMKIRLAPNLDLATHYQLKVLIIGAGTIGCNLARGLLSWGVTHLTFVDYSKVSASNLLRQSLFEHQDVGRDKAEAAADRIRLIYPLAVSQGVNLSIPMPGHPETDSNNLAERVECLENLIRETDLIFLGTDNRESRWLPSLIANVLEKPLINIAIGFDSWVVMRHPFRMTLPGVRLLKFEKPLLSSPVQSLTIPSVHNCFQPKQSPSEGLDIGYSLTSLGRIGIGSLEIGSSYEPIDLDDVSVDLILELEQFSCYFCPEIEGVQNTMIDRTMDERCTVTRGGISLIAPGMAVELAIGLLNHPKKFQAKGAKNHTYQCDRELTRHFPPQQIRGNMVDFSITQYLGRRNPNCVCCSEAIAKYYEDGNFKIKFLEKVLKDPNLLKSLSGQSEFAMPNSIDTL